jgi:integrase
MRFKKVNGVVYVGVKPRRGRTKWASMGTEDLREAKALAKMAGIAEREMAAKIGALATDIGARISGVRGTTTVSEAISQFEDELTMAGRSQSTISSYVGALKAWASLRTDPLEDVRVTSITASHFDPFFNPVGYSRSLNTLRLRKAACSAFCAYCVRLGLMNVNHADSVGIRVRDISQEQKIPKSHIPWSESEVMEVVARAVLEDKRFWVAAVMLAQQTGLRLGDVCCLEKYSLEDGVIRLKTAKTNTLVEYGAVTTLGKLLAMCEGNGTPYVFPTQRSIYLSKDGCATLSTEFRRLCARAGVSGKTFHGLRTTFIQKTKPSKAEELLDEMATLQTARAVGHKGVETTKIYLSAGSTGSEQKQT